MASPTDEDDVSCILELFGGRFNSSEIEVLLNRYNNDKREVADFLLTTDPSEVRRSLGVAAEGWNLVTNLRDFKRAPHKVDRAKAGRIHTSVRLFSCVRHDSFWWRRVPNRKMVSKCNSCRMRYRAVPRKREWGLAEYTCGYCYHTFKNWGQMELVYIPCPRCYNPCKPIRILPPPPVRRGPRRFVHSCLAPDCFNRAQAVERVVEYSRSGFAPHYEAGPLRITCVHPVSRERRGLPKIVEASEEHQSTGSTVATFLDQSDLREMYDDVKLVFSPPLPTIPENQS